jgi:hypothetical protein
MPASGTVHYVALPAIIFVHHFLLPSPAVFGVISFLVLVFLLSLLAVFGAMR